MTTIEWDNLLSGMINCPTPLDFATLLSEFTLLIRKFPVVPSLYLQTLLPEEVTKPLVKVIGTAFSSAM